MSYYYSLRTLHSQSSSKTFPIATYFIRSLLFICSLKKLIITST